MSGSEPTADAARSAAQEAARRRLARVSVPLLVLAVLVPSVVTFGTLWSRLSDDLAAARREQAGITALRPLVTLLAATADAQSEAVAGSAPDPKPLKAAVAAMDAADAAVGAGLGTDRRWADLRSRLGHLTTTTARGASAYTAFSQVTDLEQALVVAVTDAAGLPFDPALDSHYLVEVTSDHIPSIIVGAGRIGDLTLLLEQKKVPAQPDALVVAVAQSELTATADALSDGLRKGFEDADGRSLGPTLLRELDRLQDAATDLTPPLSAVGEPAAVRPAAASRTAARQLRDAAVTASGAGLDRLSTLVELRAAAAATTRREITVVTGAGLLVVVAVLWFVAARRRVVPDLPEPEDRPEGEDLPRTGARLPESDRPASADDLIEARDLLESRQLIRVGRAVSSPRAEDPPPEEGA